MKSIKARKQRKELYNAPIHKKRKGISSHLEENLILKYDKRAVPVIKGDAVKVMRGSYKGHSDKVAQVNVKKRYIEVEGIFLTKSDGKKIAKPMHASNVIITKLNLTDKWRRKKLERGLSEETKKEIEKEAKEQIKEVEDEKRQREAEEKARQSELDAEEETVEDEEITTEPDEKIETKEEETKPAAKKTETKKPAEKKTVEKKPTNPKTTTATKKAEVKKATPKTEEKTKTTTEKKPAAKKTTPEEEETKTPPKAKPKKEEE